MYELIPSNHMALSTEEDMRKGTKLKFYSSAYFPLRPLPQNPHLETKCSLWYMGVTYCTRTYGIMMTLQEVLLKDMSLATLSISLARLLQWSYNPQLFELN